MTDDAKKNETVDTTNAKEPSPEVIAAVTGRHGEPSRGEPNPEVIAAVTGQNVPGAKPREESAPTNDIGTSPKERVDNSLRTQGATTTGEGGGSLPFRSTGDAASDIMVAPGTTVADALRVAGHGPTSHTIRTRDGTVLKGTEPVTAEMGTITTVRKAHGG